MLTHVVKISKTHTAMKNTDFMNSHFLGMGEGAEDRGRVQKGPQIYLKSISEKTKT